MAEKLVNKAGLEEFATKIKEDVPLIGSIGSGTGIDTNAMGSYSLEEVATPFTWIDGKKIYKRTVDCGTLPDTNIKYVNIGDSVDKVINAQGIFFIDRYDSYSPLPYPALLADYTVELNTQDTRIRIGTSREWEKPNQVYVTVYYTKS